jgi:LCP family protein required for cell wall assembly
LLIGFSIVLALLCGAAATAVWYAYDRVGDLQRVTITHAPETVTVPTGGLSAASPTTPTQHTLSGPAMSFLLVGSDSRSEACIDPNSPYAGGFGGVSSNLSDTIMLVRVDPSTSQAAILSFPRDLWVSIAGTGRKSKINSAYEKDDPSRLVQTIEEDFSLHIDHYVEVSFCAFKGLVNAVGGVKIPFAYPTRDKNTGLNVPAPGCVAFNGDAALAYVRSRHYEYSLDGGRTWRQDGNDYGRIARQQDFIRRALQKAIDKGARNPAVAKNLLDVALENVRVDQDLTPGNLFDLASTLRSFDPNQLASHSYRIDGHGATHGGESIIEPDLNAPTTKAVLRVFRGEARLADVPSPNVAATPSTTRAATATGASATATTVPSIVVAPNPQGVTPPNDPSCR